MNPRAAARLSAAHSLDARFEHVEEVALSSWSNCEVAAAVRELRERFRLFCEVAALQTLDASQTQWPRMALLPTRPPVPPPPQPLGVIR